MTRTIFLLPFLAFQLISYAAPNYVIAVSKATRADAAWSEVVQALQTKHEARGTAVLEWDKSPEEILPALKAAHPAHTCFVAKPSEATRPLVHAVHQLTRQLDADPYTDTQWGILTGFDAANALEIARESKPLTIHNVGSGTELAMDRLESGMCFSELQKGHAVEKTKGGEAVEKQVEPDTTKALVDYMNAGPDLWVTSGHATERDWMIGFRYKNGYWKSRGGQLYGEDTKGQIHPVNSPKPKVYLPIGNCLMGHIDGPDAMALAFLKSAGVRQMAGYIHPTWYGYQGWGMLDYFVEQPGRFTLAEAYHANLNSLIHRLAVHFPGAEALGFDANPDQLKITKTAAGLTRHDLKGLLFDRDNVAFYGDPAWEARMATGLLNWAQTLKVSAKGVHRFTISPKAGNASWKPVNLNGSQRGGRPIIQYFTKRIDPAKVVITEGSEWKPLITDDFILVPLPSTNSGTVKVVFECEPQN